MAAEPSGGVHSFQSLKKVCFGHHLCREREFSHELIKALARTFDGVVERLRPHLILLQ